MIRSLSDSIKFLPQTGLHSVILDGSGTLIRSNPAYVFQRVFSNAGISITLEEASRPMGMRKDLHIQTILNLPEVKSMWKANYGSDPTKEDALDLYATYVPLQIQSLEEGVDLLPGAKETVLALQDMDIKVGLTTGFSGEMLDVIWGQLVEEGVILDVAVSGDDVLHGSRPAPFMLYHCLEMMNAFPIHGVLKVDDTPIGIQEGLNAGCWTMGVTTYSDLRDEGEDEEKVCKILLDAGAHFVGGSLPHIFKLIIIKE